MRDLEGAKASAGSICAGALHESQQLVELATRPERTHQEEHARPASRPTSRARAVGESGRRNAPRSLLVALDHRGVGYHFFEARHHELGDVEVEPEIDALRLHAAIKARATFGPAEDVGDARAPLVLDRAKDLDRVDRPRPIERVAQAPVVAGQGEERHLELAAIDGAWRTRYSPSSSLGSLDATRRACRCRSRALCVYAPGRATPTTADRWARARRARSRDLSMTIGKEHARFAPHQAANRAPRSCWWPRARRRSRGCRAIDLAGRGGRRGEVTRQHLDALDALKGWPPKPRPRLAPRARR